jgi:hypothetical protein
MQTSHLKALQNKHSKLEQDIHAEMVHAARDEVRIEKLKKEKLHVKELIIRTQEETGSCT